MRKEILENEHLLVEVDENGAELTNLFSKTSNNNVLWSGDKKYWGRVAPVLFPIVGKLRNDEIKIDGQKRNIHQHGFARDSKFEIVEKTNDKLVYHLKQNPELKNIYPYEFQLIISYIIKNNSLIVGWNVKNNDIKAMYFSIGGHPAFSVPHNCKEELNSYRLVLKGNDKIYEYIMNPPFIKGRKYIDNPNELTIDSSLFTNDAIIYSGLEMISLYNINGGNRISVEFQGFPYVGIWSKSSASKDSMAPFVCIEPWYGIADFENGADLIEKKAGIQKLSASQEFFTSYKIIIE
ncbi:aldose 1-epimerase family protein [Alkaliphilus peptidifermentans]|uniref:Galactose mutarotase n=1 Tax=Alkaliphilus peptidifermentans DSM 18978 TaxID=1120976 RepID=A0A1G5G085_9FIRM|nr:aldose 1-epimerase family protein [Alkaliphilus peptidifermentans]SCY45005.1 Galactose mutarotase [Alkaliphilus peptidifermentans DSM 18978]